MTEDSPKGYTVRNCSCPERMWGEKVKKFLWQRNFSFQEREREREREELAKKKEKRDSK